MCVCVCVCVSSTYMHTIHTYMHRSPHTTLSWAAGILLATVNQCLAPLSRRHTETRPPGTFPWVQEAEMHLAEALSSGIKCAKLHQAHLAFDAGQKEQALEHLKLYLSKCLVEAREKCAGCHQVRGDDAPMLTCSGCGVARFCNADHQRMASRRAACGGSVWKARHKDICGILRTWREVFKGAEADSSFLQQVREIGGFPVQDMIVQMYKKFGAALTVSDIEGLVKLSLSEKLGADAELSAEEVLQAAQCSAVRPDESAMRNRRAAKGLHAVHNTPDWCIAELVAFLER